MSAVRLCKDCAHCNDEERCTAPQNVQIGAQNYVTGIGNTTRRKWYGAQYCREDTESCGPEARWFEPLKPEGA